MGFQLSARDRQRLAGCTRTWRPWWRRPVHYNGRFTVLEGARSAQAPVQAARSRRQPDAAQSAHTPAGRLGPCRGSGAAGGGNDSLGGLGVVQAVGGGDEGERGQAGDTAGMGRRLDDAQGWAAFPAAARLARESVSALFRLVAPYLIGAGARRGLDRARSIAICSVRGIGVAAMWRRICKDSVAGRSGYCFRRSYRLCRSC